MEQKHLHLLQVVESEKTAKWQYTRHCQELTLEIKKLREEVRSQTGLVLTTTVKKIFQLDTLKKDGKLLPQRRQPWERDRWVEMWRTFSENLIIFN